LRAAPVTMVNHERTLLDTQPLQNSAIKQISKKEYHLKEVNLDYDPSCSEKVVINKETNHLESNQSDNHGAQKPSGKILQNSTIITSIKLDNAILEDKSINEESPHLARKIKNSSGNNSDDDSAMSDTNIFLESGREIHKTDLLEEEKQQNSDNTSLNVKVKEVAYLKKKTLQRTSRITSKLTHLKIHNALIDSLFEQEPQSMNKINNDTD